MTASPPHPFTAHNIDLGAGEQTFPEEGWLLADGRLCRSALRSLQMVFRRDEIARTTIADLGCLEGGYTVEFARAGFRATGVEARAINIAKCNYVADALKLENLSFVEADVRNFLEGQTFDAIFCSGLLYHLDDPTEFLGALSASCRRVLILQTHFASDELPSDEGLAAKLSPLESHEGNLGRWYVEFPDDTSQPEMEEAVWASWGNHRSFWIDKRHLLQSLRDVGFAGVYEQYDFLENVVTDDYIERNGRSMFVALKADNK